ncbi:MAG: hypothetical protein WCA49_09015 [Candidatus Sulfotelmatobacter sp.]
MSTSGSNNQSTPPPERSRVAEIVTAFALAGIFLLSAMVLIRSWKSNDDEMVRYVFASIIPLLGSWMGTILAFYFSKDNLAAATQSVKDLSQAMTSQDKLKAIPVKDKMRPLDQIKHVKVDPTDDANKKLSDLSQMSAERIPILSSQSVIRFLIYKAMIDKYLAQLAGKSLPAGKTTVADLTLKDLVDSNPEMRKLFENSFAFVPLTATLADAKREMEKIDNCGDVLVTNTGKKEEPILGWVTDNTIIENSKI